MLNFPSVFLSFFPRRAYLSSCLCTLQTLRTDGSHPASASASASCQLKRTNVSSPHLFPPKLIASNNLNSSFFVLLECTNRSISGGSSCQLHIQHNNKYHTSFRFSSVHLIKDSSSPTFIQRMNFNSAVRRRCQRPSIKY